MLSELSHVHEAMQQLEKHSADPFALPAASEQVSQYFITLITLTYLINTDYETSSGKES